MMRVRVTLLLRTATAPSAWGCLGVVVAGGFAVAVATAEPSGLGVSYLEHGISASPARPADIAIPAGAAKTPTSPDSAAEQGRLQAPADSSVAAADDLAARRYLNTCAGCHSLAGAKLNGPALSHVATWPREQIESALRRMEKNVGPLSSADIDLFVGFLQAQDNQERLAREQERIRAEFAAKMAPPDAARGERLFQGHVALEHGGLACFACHRFAGFGGRLGPDLGDAGARLGKQALVSGISGAAYRVMAPHYERHPITPQEAIHLAEYLATPPAAVPAPRRVTPFLAGGLGAGLAFVGLAVSSRRGGRSRRSRS